MADQAQRVKESVEFGEFPDAIQSWLLMSPSATEQCSEFFLERGGKIEVRSGQGLPAFAERPEPTIFVDESRWNALKNAEPNDSRVIEMFGALTHELGHMHHNTGSPPFQGGSEQQYVQYRSGLEAKAIFNAFRVYSEIEGKPGAPDKPPFGGFGYVHGLEAGGLYRQWRAGEITEEQTVSAVAKVVPQTTYSRYDKPPDYNTDGVVTHSDKYIEDYRLRYLPAQQRLQRENPITSGESSENLITPRAAASASAAARPSNPRDKDDPHHLLYLNLRAGVERAEADMGKGWDDNSERLTASLTLLAKQKGFGNDDKFEVGFSTTTPTSKPQPGELVFLNRVGGNASPDPHANRAQMDTAQAISRSPEAVYRDLDTYGLTQAHEQARTPTQPPDQTPKGPDDPSRGGRTLP